MFNILNCNSKVHGVVDPYRLRCVANAFSLGIDIVNTFNPGIDFEYQQYLEIIVNNPASCR